MAPPRRSPRGPPGVEPLAATSSSGSTSDPLAVEFVNFCRNPFCGAGLLNRAAYYCEESVHCQLYRALQLHCEFGQASDETASGAAIHPQSDNFSIPRRKRKQPADVDVDADADTTSGEAASSNGDVKQKRKKKKKSKRVLNQTSSEWVAVDTSESIELPTEARVRQRRIRHDAEASGQAGSAVVEDAPLGPRDDPTTARGRASTAAQAVKQMDIELVALGASNQPVSFAGGGRYVQSGNRSASQSLPLQPAVVRPPQFGQFPPSAVESTSAGPDKRSSHRDSLAGPRAVPPARPTDAANGMGNHAAGVEHHHPSLHANIPRPMMRRGKAPDEEEALNRSTTIDRTHRSSSVSSAESATSKSGPTRISTLDYLTSRKTPAPPESRSSATSSSHDDVPPSYRRHASNDAGHRRERDGYRGDEADLSFSGWDPPPPSESARTHRAPPPTEQQNYRRDYRRPPLGRSASYTDEYKAPPLPPPGRPDYRRSHSDIGSSYSRSARNPVDAHPERPYVDTYYDERARYRDERRNQSSRNHEVDERPRQDYYVKSEERNDRRSPRNREGHVDASYRDRPSWLEPGSEQGANRSGEHRQTHPFESHRASEYLDAQPPTFSYHDAFVSELVSTFISKLPSAIGAIVNETKKPRKMKFYLDYVARVVRECEPLVKITMRNNRAVVMVKGREWMSLKDSSTITLYRRMLLRLLAEAQTWGELKEKAAQIVRDNTAQYGDKLNLGISFLSVWNRFKMHMMNDNSVERQVRYFCGERRHHWSFVVGRVEIGSGSHEDRRFAFNIAANKAVQFLMNLGNKQPHRYPSPTQRIDEAMLDGSGHARNGQRPLAHTSSVPLNNEGRYHDRQGDRLPNEYPPIPVDGRVAVAAPDPGRSRDSRTRPPPGDGAAAATRANIQAVPESEAANASILRSDDLAASNTNMANTQTIAREPKESIYDLSASAHLAGGSGGGGGVDPGRPADPRIRRPPSDPRVRRPPTDPRLRRMPSDSRLVGDASSQNGRAVDLRVTPPPVGGANEFNPPASVAVPSSNTIENNSDDDRMSISEESDRGVGTYLLVMILETGRREDINDDNLCHRYLDSQSECELCSEREQWAAGQGQKPVPHVCGCPSQ